MSEEEKGFVISDYIKGGKENIKEGSKVEDAIEKARTEGVRGFAPFSRAGDDIRSFKITKRGAYIWDKKQECPFCGKETTFIGHWIHARGIDNVAVGVCPYCHRIIGEY